MEASKTELCAWCDGFVLATERARSSVVTEHGTQPLHQCCAIRMVVGSYSCLSSGPHKTGTCAGDDPMLSKYENARKAYEYWEANGRQLPALID